MKTTPKHYTKLLRELHGHKDEIPMIRGALALLRHINASLAPVGGKIAEPTGLRERLRLLRAEWAKTH